MAHFSRLCKIVLDVPAADHDKEVAFWQAAAGHPLTAIEGEPEYHGALLDSPRMWLFVQRLDEGSSRMHLDIHTDDVDAEVSRVERLGAVRVRQVRSWWVMQDPAGLFFCVLPSAPGTLDESNARRWE
jgi:Glyoxalase-like domain